mmetsp:Transcript_47979/g.88980  ORF Transcript_47979/g.88980 Transcript_47979/m.88980 type:complete len:260 (-) Transcript_47979:149-928(-)
MMVFLKSSNASRDKSCCTWPLAIAFLVSLAVTVILVLALGPLEQGVSKAMPNFEPVDFGDDQLPGLVPSTNAPSTSPVFDEPQYEFIQCLDNGGECCNGREGNCELRLNEMLFAMAHNAMSTEESGYDIGFNHYKNLDGALRAGFRGLNLDVCKCDGRLSFCHTICGYGDRNPYQVLLEVKAFLDEHPTEFVVFVFQFSTGSPSLAELFGVMSSIDGFVEKMLVVDPDEPEWPLLRDLIYGEEKKVWLVRIIGSRNCLV